MAASTVWRRGVRGVATLKCDPSKVTIGVARHCGAHDAIADYRGIEYARIFRDATMELLGLDNLNEIIARIDGV